jgi:hypothetical protein
LPAWRSPLCCRGTYWLFVDAGSGSGGALGMRLTDCRNKGRHIVDVVLPIVRMAATALRSAEPP